MKILHRFVLFPFFLKSILEFPNSPTEPNYAILAVFPQRNNIWCWFRYNNSIGDSLNILYFLLLSLFPLASTFAMISIFLLFSSFQPYYINVTFLPRSTLTSTSTTSWVKCSFILTFSKHPPNSPSPPNRKSIIWPKLHPSCIHVASNFESISSKFHLDCLKVVYRLEAT